MRFPVQCTNQGLPSGQLPNKKEAKVKVEVEAKVKVEVQAES
jgi:translation initiation factor IF-1